MGHTSSSDASPKMSPTPFRGVNHNSMSLLKLKDKLSLRNSLPGFRQALPPALPGMELQTTASNFEVAPYYKMKQAKRITRVRSITHPPNSQAMKYRRLSPPKLVRMDDMPDTIILKEIARVNMILKTTRGRG